MQFAFCLRKTLAQNIADVKLCGEPIAQNGKCISLLV